MEQRSTEPIVGSSNLFQDIDLSQSSSNSESNHSTTQLSQELPCNSSCTIQHGPLLPETPLSVRSIGKPLQRESNVGRVRGPGHNATLLAEKLPSVDQATKRKAPYNKATIKRSRIPTKAISSPSGQKGLQTEVPEGKITVWFKEDEITVIGYPDDQDDNQEQREDSDDSGSEPVDIDATVCSFGDSCIYSP